VAEQAEIINVTRHVNIKTMRLKVKVLTPMFLGGSDGNAELRAAPFKAALRYWWRVLQGEVPKEALLKQETSLFGGVSEDAWKSRVSVYVKGNVTIEIPKMGNLLKIHHPEAERAKCQVDGPGYLAGMGHYDFRNGFKKRAILPGQRFELTVRYPVDQSDIIEKVIWLMNRFGTVGGRSRNGFGSFCFDTPNNVKVNCLPTIDFQQALRHKNNPYPHFLTKDHKGLTFWKLQELDTKDCSTLMRSLAEIYIRLRTSPFFKFNNGGPGNRHLLGYPIMNHNLRDWGGPGGRLPSQLRLMVKPDDNDDVNGFVLHMAHALPEDKKWFPELASEEEIWHQVHDFLDNHMTRITI